MDARKLGGSTAGGASITIHRSATDSVTRPSAYGGHFYLKIINDDERATFLISGDGRRWEKLAGQVDVSTMNHNNFKGFLTLRPTLVSAGTGVATFDNFEYRPKD